MTSKPKLSVAMCTHNGQAHVQLQLNSIAGQSRLPDELVVCDDGSTDQTANIVERFSRDAPFQVHLHVNPHRMGTAQNFANAIRRCEGDLICLADQDDVWHEKKLEQFHQVFGRTPQVGLVFCNLNLVDEALEPTGRTQWQALGFDSALQQLIRGDRAFEVLLKFNVINGAAMGFHARFRDFLLPIPETWTHDEWIALLVSAVAPVQMIEAALVDYRQHTHQQIGGGISGIRAQLTYARRHMQRSYFEKMLERTKAARDRLASVQSQYPSAKSLALLGERVVHMQRRLQMRDRSIGGRLPMVVGEWRQGRYNRFGYGWKSMMQDLFLA